MCILKPHLISKALGVCVCVCVCVCVPMNDFQHLAPKLQTHLSIWQLDVSPLMSLGIQCPTDNSGFPLQNLVLFRVFFFNKKESLIHPVAKVWIFKLFLIPFLLLPHISSTNKFCWFCFKVYPESNYFYLRHYDPDPAHKAPPVGCCHSLLTEIPASTPSPF